MSGVVDLMLCENCNAELAPGVMVCPDCQAPAVQNIEGFDNTKAIQRLLKQMIVENGRDVPSRNSRLISVINDYLVDFDKERRLLVYTINAGVIKNMFSEKDRTVALMITRNSLINDCFITENAAEFVLACFTYMFKWPYDSPLRVREEGEPPAPKREKAAEQPVEEQPAAADTKNKEKPAQPLSIDSKVFRPKDAMKFRLSRNVVIPEGYTSLEGFCFDGYGFVQNLKLPDTLLAIGEYAFSGCKHLREIVLPETMKILQQGAFSQCVSLTEMKLPHGILAIEDNTFLCCESLESVDIPSTVSSIGAQAFSGCEKLKKLIVPESVKFIDENAFLYCPELTVYCYENSYVHKYCLNNDIKVQTFAIGTDLHADNLVKEG